jgi:hypothetical protein
MPATAPTDLGPAALDYCGPEGQPPCLVVKIQSPRFHNKQRSS